MASIAIFFITVFVSAAAQTAPPERDVTHSCNVWNDCFGCVSASCAWSQPFQVAIMEVSKASSHAEDIGRAPFCTDTCADVGTAASCFVLKNFVGLAVNEVCDIANRPEIFSATILDAQEKPIEAIEKPMEEQEIMTPTTTTITTPDNLRSQSPTTSPSSPPSVIVIPAVHAVVQLPTNEHPNLPIQSTGVLIHSVDPPSSSPTETPTTSTTENMRTPTNNDADSTKELLLEEDEEVVEINSAENSTVMITNSTNTTTSNNTATDDEETPTSCAGFVVCEECPTMKCVFAAWSCSSYCPELTHVPCWEIRGNYTHMTKADVCIGEQGIGVEDDEEEMEVATNRIPASVVQADGIRGTSAAVTTCHYIPLSLLQVAMTLFISAFRIP